MTVKLRINLADGTFEAEGEDVFVREMHSEFQEYVGRFFGERLARSAPVPVATETSEPQEVVGQDDAPFQSSEEQAARGKRATPRRRRVVSPVEGGPVRKGKYEPKVDPDLKLPGLIEAFGGYDLKGHKDFILFFSHYLEHDAGIQPFTADQIFTCYRMVKVKPPSAFLQALYDTRGVRHFIKFDKLDAISMTHLGDTHFEHDLKKKD